MAEIKVKRSSVAGKVPVVSDLALGEFAINTHDGLVFIKKNVAGTDSIVTINGGSEGGDINIDGGSAASVYLISQTIDGGGA
jgi:hypothetical protein